MCVCFCFLKQKTAYELRISDWSSDVCSSDRAGAAGTVCAVAVLGIAGRGFRRLALGAVTLHQLHQDARNLVEKQQRHGERNLADPVRSSDARRVGKECVSTRRPRWTPNPVTKKSTTTWYPRSYPTQQK